MSLNTRFAYRSDVPVARRSVPPVQLGDALYALDRTTWLGEVVAVGRAVVLVWGYDRNGRARIGIESRYDTIPHRAG